MKTVNKEFYMNQDISFSIEERKFHTLNFIRACQRATIPHHSHGNGCYEIHYVVQGRGEAEISGKVWALEPGTLYVTGPHIEHAQRTSEKLPVWEYCIYLKLEESTSLDSLTCLFENIAFWIGYEQYQTEYILQELFSELENRDTGYKVQAETYLKQLLILLIRQYKQKLPSKSERVTEGIASRDSLIIEESFLYDYQTLTLDGLSRRLGLSQRQTERLLQKQFGKNFQKKKQEARMAAAAAFLTDTKESITEISQRLGYSTMEHFSSTFRSWFGMSPTQYRKQKMDDGIDTRLL